MNLSGVPLDFLFAFIGGVLVSFSPCVYPLLPITIVYIGANSVNSRLKGFILSIIYVTGISVTYVFLGLIAVATGTFFGRFSSQPVVRIIVGVIIIIFGFTLWAGQGIRVPVFKIPFRMKTGNYFSCFLLGITSGLLISPCVAPVLGAVVSVGAILRYISVERNFIYGIFLLLSFAYGMGFTLILAGTFSSVLSALPKAGQWMEIMKKICAVVLVIMGIYFFVMGAVDLGPVDFGFSRFGEIGVVYAKENKKVKSALNFTLFDLNGNKMVLSEFRDKKAVILLFWTTWCPFCVRGIYALDQNYYQLVLDDIEVLAINVEESEYKVTRFINRRPVGFSILFDHDAGVAQSYGLIGVPTYVLINKKGDIVFYDNYFPYDDYKQLLEN